MNPIVRTSLFTACCTTLLIEFLFRWLTPVTPATAYSQVTSFEGETRAVTLYSGGIVVGRYLVTAVEEGINGVAFTTKSDGNLIWRGPYMISKGLKLPAFDNDDVVE